MFNFLWPTLALLGALLAASVFLIDTDFTQIGAVLLIIGALGGISQALKKKALFVRGVVLTWTLVATSFIGLTSGWLCESFGCIAWMFPISISLVVGISLLFINAFALYKLENKRRS